MAIISTGAIRPPNGVSSKKKDEHKPTYKERTAKLPVSEMQDAEYQSPV